MDGMEVSMENETGPTPTVEEAGYAELIGWLEARGAQISGSLIRMKRYDGLGMGVEARRGIGKGTTLFSIPRYGSPRTTPLLSVRSSALLDLLSDDERARISRNWLPLLLVLLWERVRAIRAPNDPLSWAPYFHSLPTHFDTLMFWTAEELAELKGSAILDKIGREEAEKDYWEVVKPFIESRGDLFPVPRGTSWETHYGLDVYHQMGSLVLSRSFHVEADPRKTTQNKTDGDGLDDVAMNSGSDHDDACDDNDDDEQDDGEELDREAVDDIAMVPLADLLNAKTGCENAKLFYETDWLRMKTTRKIEKGEQIYNTYGDPPNSDLLRRYGHVDEENRFDVVEVSGKTCLEVVREHLQAGSQHARCEDLERRLEWALEMGVDDAFELTTEQERKKKGLTLIPEDMGTLLKILTLPSEEMLDCERKGKLPTWKRHQMEVRTLAKRVVDRRMMDYPTSIQEDQQELDSLRQSMAQAGDCSHDQTMMHQPMRRKMQAVLVRKSEKEILLGVSKLLAHRIKADTSSTV
ncbi:hypothetical protein PCANC_16397 [Puccinia coronata f. sp. avenae]|uniref:Ribosomal lysine N-methyltransferase 4 n=2 Tax=Puccinia coronata f. sp. avenae TaxID=200324 RepID=A0A2N5SYJ3_9BASI|nr:hypothetical protein PCANC_16397 [Puccinia coronata f. sp. avenae]